jgi:hypothetical protein
MSDRELRERVSKNFASRVALRFEIRVTGLCRFCFVIRD